MQADDRPDPRGLDPAPGPVALLPLDHPALGRAERASPHGRDRTAAVGVAGPVEQEEGAPPAVGRRGGRQGGAAQLVDAEGDGTRRPERGHDRERHDRLPGPAAERVDREGRAHGKQDLLGRERRHSAPRPEPQQREPHAREHAAPGHTARLADERRCAAHVLGVGRVAGEPKRNVRLDRGREVARPSEVGGPRAVGALPAADPGRCSGSLVRLEQPEVVAQEEILGVDGHVRLELALPPAALVLEGEQVPGRALEARLRRVDPAVGCDRHAAGSSSSSRAGVAASASFAAVIPLRTALSIVAGQPVSVHEPAR